MTTGTAKNIVGGLLLGKALETMGFDPHTQSIANRHLQEAATGAEVGALSELALSKITTGRALPRLSNVLRGGAGAAVGAVSESLVAEGVGAALQAAGASAETSYAVSHITGGMVGGGLSVASVPVAGAVAQRGMLSASRAMERRGATSVAARLARMGGRLAAREAASAGIGSAVPVVGTAVGAVVGGVLDAVDVAQTIGGILSHESNPATYVMLNPGWNGPLDSEIGQNPEVKRLIYAYNNRQRQTGYNHADADLEELTRQVQTVVNGMGLPAAYRYTASFSFVPSSATDGLTDAEVNQIINPPSFDGRANSVMLPGAYDTVRDNLGTLDRVGFQRRQERLDDSRTLEVKRRVEIGMFDMSLYEQAGLDVSKLGHLTTRQGIERAQQILRLRRLGVPLPVDLERTDLTALLARADRIESGEEARYLSGMDQMQADINALQTGLAELRAAGGQTPSYDDIVHADESTYPQYAPGPLQQLLAETRARVGAVVTPEKK